MKAKPGAKVAWRPSTHGRAVLDVQQAVSICHSESEILGRIGVPKVPSHIDYYCDLVWALDGTVLAPVPGIVGALLELIA
jgi:hypothetical protein